MTLFILSFVAGLLTVLAPCVLPLLPVIVGGSLDGTGGQSKKRAFTVITSLAVSLIAFTFLLKVSTVFITIPEVTWKYLSGGIIIGFGILWIFPSIMEKLSFMGSLGQKSNALLGKGLQKKSIWGDVIVGAALGPVFATCSPTYFLVLATVLPVSVALGFTYILVYTIGLCLALLGIVAIGQKIMGKLGVAADPHGKFKKILGLVFILVGLGIISGYDKKLELAIYSVGFFDTTKVEQNLIKTYTQPPAVQNTSVYPTDTQIQETANATPSQSTETNSSSLAVPLKTTVGQVAPGNPPKPKTAYLSVAAKERLYKRAPEITGAAGYINTNELPVLLSQYKGKSVVLIDFWTYSCINCQRTIPYLTQWHG